jgi:hypothetical protein
METLDVQGKVEEAFTRVLDPYLNTGDLSVLQLVTSFFTGKPLKDRLSVTVPNCEKAWSSESSRTE